MSLDPASIAGAALWGVYITWKELVPLVRRNGTNGNGAAGAKSVDFWRLELREELHSSLDRTLTPKFDAQIALLVEVKDSMADVSKGVAELVTLQRASQHAPPSSAPRRR
jgi:hypothetical protein